MNERMMINPLIRELREAGLQWQQIADRVNDDFGLQLTPDACRKRNESFNPDTITIKVGNDEETTTYGDGTKERTLKSKESLNNFSNRDKLTKLGENPNEVELVWYSEKKWEAQTPDGIETLYSVGYKVKPTKKEITPIDYLKVAQDTFSKSIKPLSLPNKKENKILNKDLMLMIPALEGHFNKKSYAEISEEYNTEIAKNRFRRVILEFLKEQQLRRAANCYMTVGNDLFNSDTPNNTTTAGTQMTNDVHWKMAFRIVLELYTETLLSLREHFNKVDIALMQGNHDNVTSFMLYEALRMRFHNDKIINFDNSLRETTHFVFGKNLIINNHGDKNIKKLVENIPSKYKKEWAEAEFVYLFSGHLHHDLLRKNQNGVTHHQLSSISATDEWHETNNYIGALQQQQFFIFHKEYGKIGEMFIVFPKNDKELIKKQ
jgi:hypothetical protein